MDRGINIPLMTNEKFNIWFTPFTLTFSITASWDHRFFAMVFSDELLVLQHVSCFFCALAWLELESERPTWFRIYLIPSFARTYSRGTRVSMKSGCVVLCKHTWAGEAIKTGP